MTDRIDPFPGGRVVRLDSGDLEVQISGDAVARALGAAFATALPRTATVTSPVDGATEATDADARHQGHDHLHGPQ